MTITIEKFGRSGTPQVDLIRMSNASGSHIALIPVGARLVEAHFPDRDGRLTDVVLGFDTVHDYLNNDTYAGSIAGRYANRIIDGRFRLGGEAFQLERNEGRNHIHGGSDGLDRQHWDFSVDEGKNLVAFTHRSPDGHAGYPGALDITVTYRLQDDDVLLIDMAAATSAPTVLNLVHHSYWNLAGHGSGSVLGQNLTINASTYTPVDDDLLATGEIRSVRGTAFDFMKAHPIGALIEDVPAVGGAGRLDPDAAAGYDHNWVLDGPRHEMHLAAVLTHPDSGRRLTLSTTEAGVQVYTGGYLKALPGKGGAVYDAAAGLTLETQTFPCSPNIAYFPSARLDPGQTYRHRMHLAFDASADPDL